MVTLTVRKGLYEYVVVDDGLLSVLGGQVAMALVVRPDDGSNGRCVGVDIAGHSARKRLMGSARLPRLLARLVPVLPLINTISRYSVQYVNADFKIRIRQNYHFEYFCESPSKKHSQEHSPRYSKEFDHDGREAPYLFWNGLRHDPNGLWQSKLSQV